MSWHEVATRTALQEGPKVVRAEGRQIALFLACDQVYAIDNRCPHEGYPLIQGQVNESCVLTCAWHNWKFRLEDGECILGGDHVRAYPVRQEGDRIFVNVESKPAAEVAEKILIGLRTAYEERDYGRICREIARLHFNDLNPVSAVAHAIHWSHDRLQFGTTHAFAATADWIALYDSLKSDLDNQLVCLAEAVDHMSDDTLRQPIFPYATGDVPFSPEGFQTAIENEYREKAEAMTQNALRESMSWAELEPSFATAALAHMNDFGHSAIYVYKTSQLLERLNLDEPAWLVLPLVRHLCYTTREDLLPPFREYGKALDAMPQLSQKGGSEDAASLYGQSTSKALQWCVEAARRSSAEVIYDTLLTALARQLLHFDLAWEAQSTQPPKDNVGWLDFTHGITFANAVRNLCGRYPELWRPALLQMACFVGRNRAYLDHELGEEQWMVEDVQAFLKAAKERVLDHGLRAPIFSAHLVKTTLAVEEELEHASEECQRYLLASVNRFLHSPIKQKHTKRLARQAIKLVGLD